MPSRRTAKPPHRLLAKGPSDWPQPISENAWQGCCSTAKAHGWRNRVITEEAADIGDTAEIYVITPSGPTQVSNLAMPRAWP
jgi:hypothetical protein